MLMADWQVDMTLITKACLSLNTGNASHSWGDTNNTKVSHMFRWGWAESWGNSLFESLSWRPRLGYMGEYCSGMMT